MKEESCTLLQPMIMVFLLVLQFAPNMLSFEFVSAKSVHHILCQG